MGEELEDVIDDEKEEEEEDAIQTSGSGWHWP